MAKTISATVGKDSAGRLAHNRFQDVISVEELLNQVPPDQGGPLQKLPASGVFTQQTFLAICKFQERKFGWADGLVEPYQRTIAELNKFDKVAEIPRSMMRVIGEQQQLFRGDPGLGLGEMGVFVFNVEPTNQSGNGVRQIKVVKQAGPSAPQFFLAATTVERLTVWLSALNIERSNVPWKPGTDMHLTLSKAIVSAVSSFPSEIHSKLQELTFFSEQLSWEYRTSVL